MKTYTNKAIGDNALRSAYYMNHSAKRYAKRYSEWKRRLRAARLHQRRQIRQMREAGRYQRYVDWTSTAGEHRRKHNREWIEVERQSKERLARQAAADHAQAEEYRMEGRLEAAATILNNLK